MAPLILCTAATSRLPGRALAEAGLDRVISHPCWSASPQICREPSADAEPNGLEMMRSCHRRVLRGFEVSSVEIELVRTGPTKTVETLAETCAETLGDGV